MNKRFWGNTCRILNMIIIAAVMCTMLYVSQSADASSANPLSVVIVNQPTPAKSGIVYLTWPNYATTSNGAYKIECWMDNSLRSTIFPYSVPYNPNTWGSLIQFPAIVDLWHTYTFRLFYYDNITSSSGAFMGEVTVIITAVDTIKSLTAKPISQNKINLNWTFSGSNDYAAVIERKAGIAGAWNEIATVQAGVTSYTDTVDSASTQYYYRIRAIYSPDYYSTYFPGDNSVSSYSLLDTPEAPAGYAISPTQIVLSWNGVANATLYVIERKSSDENSYSFSYIVSADITEWTDSQLIPNATYTYRIKAISGVGASDFSPETKIACIYLEPPTNLTIQAVTETQIELNWRDNSARETGYEIWRKVGKSGSWSKYTYLNKDETKFVDEEIVKGEVHYYKIRTRMSDSNAYSTFSAEASAWAVSITPPTELQYSIGANNTMTLTWKDNSNNESAFAIERKSDTDASWSQVGTCQANYTTYTGSMPTGDAFYFYRVKAYDNTGINAASYSEEIQVAAGIPNPPSGLKVTAISPSQIKLVWTDNSNNEDGFTIERLVGSGVTFFSIANTKANVTEFIDNIYPNQKFTYRVKAFNKKGSSSTTSESSAQTMTKVSLVDMTNVAWAKDAVENLASRGLVDVSSDKKFHPLDKITKGELIHMLVKAFKLKSTVVGSFADVSPRHKYYKDIMTASRLGIVLGDGNSKFQPDSYVTREDMAVFLTRTLNSIGKPLKYHDLSVLDEYSDRDKISSYAQYSLASLRGESLIFGESAPGDIYVISPKHSATRVEAALLIYRVIDR